MLYRYSKETSEIKKKINRKIVDNYSKLKLSLFFLPLSLLITLALFLYSQDALSVDKYLLIQKNYFYYINSKLSQFPHIIYNLTQVGDALIFLSFLTIFIVHASKIWEALLSASLVSAIFSCVLKNLFRIPRPAEVYDRNSFAIIGKALPGFSSLPSGHSITIFTILTVLLFALMPNKLKYKFLWSFLILITGLILVFTRVGIGAHHPLDVIVGSIIGYICGLMGLFISRKYKIWSWIKHKK